MALVSGEAVHLDIRLARAGSRALALLLDIIVQLALFMALSIVVPIAVAVLPFADQALLSAAYIVLIATILVGYPALCHALLRGRSVGKLAMGLRVVRSDGGPINFRQSLIRALVGTALEWPGILIGLSWLVSLSLLVGSARAQRLADMAAGTIVIHERTPESWGWIPSTPPQLVTWAATLDLTDVDDQLALAARHFLARSRSLREPHRTRIGEALAKEMLTRLTPPPPPNTPGWAYLAAVVGERHRRAAARLTQARATQAKLWPELFPTLPAAPR
ncbi:RDD family protein [Allorhizocola rhizosphaerae]|uniref:RDD family protein n=1 Tax=Allorhizocola rhizosphaerae TaxID=1872709 RepID=UPI000E3C6047|nr:RDD family protein [Allorhizocola rhizosphaerae]